MDGALSVADSSSPERAAEEMIVVFDRGSDGAGALRLSVDAIFLWFGVFGYTTIGGAGSAGALDSDMLSGGRAGIALPGWRGPTVCCVAFSSR